MAKIIWAEYDPETKLPVKIFNKLKEAFQKSNGPIKEMNRREAVKLIREQVVARATEGRLTKCEFCGKIITENTGHMHEVVPKGAGGNVGLDNSRLICPECHVLAKDSEHGNRRWGGNASNTD